MEGALISWLGPAAGALFTLVVLIAAIGLVGLMISRIGWHAFAARYASDLPAGEPSFIVRNTRFGGTLASYNNAVRASFLVEGVRLGMLFPFSPGHRPFVVPWSSVRRAGLTPVLWGQRYVVEIEDEAGTIRLRLPPAAQAAVEARRPGLSPPRA